MHTGKYGTNSLNLYDCKKANAAVGTAKITGFMNRVSISTSAKTDFNRAIAYFCAKDLRPFEIINGEGFRNFVTALLGIGKKYGLLDIESLLPESRTISRNVASIAKEQQKKLQERVNPIFAKYGGAMTTDFWTDDYQKHSFLAITGHFVDDNWCLQNVLIGIFPWDADKRQTGENVQNFLYEKLNEFGINENIRRNIIFVTDEGGNLRVALCKECRLNCSAHVLNTALKNVFDQENKANEERKQNSTQPVVKSPEFVAIDNCNELVGFIRKSHLKAQLSRAVQPDVDTRWHSKINMIESVLNIWDELEELLQKRNELRHLDNVDRETLEALLKILKPFRDVITQLETSIKYPTLPLVVAQFQSLLNCLEPMSGEDGWVANLKWKLRDSVQRKLIIDQQHRIATVFHPSFRHLQFRVIDYDSKSETYCTIRDMIKTDDTGASSSTGNLEIDCAPVSPKRPRIAAAVDSLLEEFCPVLNVTTRKYELDEYLDALADRVSCTDVLSWWQMNTDRYPKLAVIARKYLAVLATSAASESVFRYGGLTVTELRNRLAPDTVCNLLFVRHFNEK